MADRFTYVSSIGLSIAVVWLISHSFDSWRVRPPMRAGFAATVVVAYAVAAFVEVSHYRDTETVFSHAIESTGDNWLAEEHLADTFLKAGDTAGAMRHFRRETEIAPTRTRGFTGIGQTLEAEGRSQEALPVFEHALRLDPNDADVANNYCVSLLQVHGLKEGVACLKHTIPLDPESPTGYSNLGRAYFAEGRLHESLQAFEDALRINPDEGAATNDRCVNLMALHRNDDALGCLQGAIVRDPTAALPYLNLATLYDKTGHPDLAAAARQSAATRSTRAH